MSRQRLAGIVRACTKDGGLLVSVVMSLIGGYWRVDRTILTIGTTTTSASRTSIAIVSALLSSIPSGTRLIRHQISVFGMGHRALTPVHDVLTVVSRALSR